MKFGECFRTLCCTFGSGELFLVSGQMPMIKAIKIDDIKRNIAWQDVKERFFDKIDRKCSYRKLETSIKAFQQLRVIEDPLGQNVEFQQILKNRASDIEKFVEVLLSQLMFTEDFRKSDISEALKAQEEKYEECDFYLGFFCFFDLRNYVVKIVSAKELRKTKRDIARTEDCFCLANLKVSHFGQDINIAEGFCKSFNTMLERNHFRQFEIMIGS